MRKKREESYITIKEVAIEAKVSIATVSRVINDGRVSEKRKRQVLDAIKKLNYVPNNSARNLASVNSTKRIAMLVPAISNNFYTNMIKGFKTGAKLYNYDPVIEDYDYDVLKYESLNLNLNKSSEIKAVVQIGPHLKNDRKIVVDFDDSLLEFDLDKSFKNKNIGLYFGFDDYLSDFFEQKILKHCNCSVLTIDKVKKSSLDFYITSTIEQASHLIKIGVTQKIYVLDETKYLNHLIPQINHFPMDMYAIGLGLSRIIIKRLTNKITDEETPLVIKVGEDINE